MLTLRHSIPDSPQAADLSVAGPELKTAVGKYLHEEGDHVVVGDHAQ